MKKIIFCTSLLFFQALFSQITLTSFSPNINHSSFGKALDAYGNDMVISATNGMNFMDGNNVFVFKKNGSIINQETFFTTPSDGIASDGFGNTVSIDNDFIAVGSPFHDEVSSNAGAVYLYRKVANSWQFIQKITAFDGIADDYFGYDVKVYNNQLFVTAIDDEPTGQPTALNNGAVYVYNFNGLNWVFFQKITLGASYKFGGKIKISNNSLAISSGSTFAPLINIHTYNFNGSNWNYSNSLNPTSTAEQYISDFNLDNNQLFVLLSTGLNANVIIYEAGSNIWNLSSTLTNVNQGDNIATTFVVKNDMMFIGSGAYILQMTRKSPLSYYKKINGNWVFQEVIYGNGNIGNDDYFGSRIAITDNLVLIGAPNENYPLPIGKAYTFDTTLGIDENTLNEFKLYPNPTNDKVFLSNNLVNEIRFIDIYQFDGKLIKQVKSNSNSISLKELSNGIYLLKITKNNGVSFTRKIVKN
ncbi:T9SS type A sorting domain-containing protein [Flavobacterium sp. RSB2_4_14]|uniref:T9SS type A sorting domain-containing protein n=1 Tax=Flavobacterium sp. RSB2_4_14 TaxID=3447665 RepID=UPI003F2C2057